MTYYSDFYVRPGERLDLKDHPPRYADKREGKAAARKQVAELTRRMDELQMKLYAEQKRSLLIVLQAPDAGGKDGVVRRVLGSMNPQGVRVVSFKQPSTEEAAHNFLWRIERQTPRRGEVAIFNRSHYEDVLVVRVHNIVPKEVWSKRYEQINHFEERLAANGTQILKFFLHISPEEQLKRFRDRLEDPTRQWKISGSDYSEREYWDEYEKAFEEALSKCSTEKAPWFVIPSDQKWFRDLAISQIVVKALEDMDIKTPEPSVNIEEIRRRFYAEVAESGDAELMATEEGEVSTDQSEVDRDE